MKKKGRLGGRAWFEAQAQSDFDRGMRQRDLKNISQDLIIAYDATYCHRHVMKMVAEHDQHS